MFRSHKSSYPARLSITNQKLQKIQNPIKKSQMVFFQPDNFSSPKYQMKPCRAQIGVKYGKLKVSYIELKNENKKILIKILILTIY